MARKFLYVIAALIMLVVAGAFAYRLFGAQLMKLALVPSAAFENQPALAGNAYADPRMWIARPGMPGDPALWTPPGYRPAATPPRPAAPRSRPGDHPGSCR